MMALFMTSLTFKIFLTPNYEKFSQLEQTLIFMSKENKQLSK